MLYTCFEFLQNRFLSINHMVESMFVYYFTDSKMRLISISFFFSLNIRQTAETSVAQRTINALLTCDRK